MVRENDRELLIAAYANFNARAIDSVLALMHPEVDWPNGMESGRVHGHEGVREYWTRQWGLINPHVQPLDFRIEEDGRITVIAHLIIRNLDGAVIVDENVKHTYLIEDGVIRKMDIGEE